MKKAGCRIDVEELYHPLLTHPVANSRSVCGGRNSADRLECVGKITFMKKHGSECDSGTGTEHESFEAVPRCCVPDHDIHGTPR